MPQKPSRDELIEPPAAPLPTPALDSESLRMSYRIARGEQGVLTFEPYKSLLLPFWRFKTVPIAKSSSIALKEAFDSYIEREDFVGADMARKFVQMGMTRSRRSMCTGMTVKSRVGRLTMQSSRYANHKGGRKYDRSAREVDRDGGARTVLPKSDGHTGKDEKAEASEVFKAVWKQCTANARYLRLKAEFLDEQKLWDRRQKAEKKTGAAVEEGEMVAVDAG